MALKQRLDLLLVERGLAPSREKARGMIMAGEVCVDGHIVDKPGAPTQPTAALTTKQKPRFVSRGGEKLASALEVFNVDVRGRICADVGASTGGFTDCLLQNGATRIYSLDVGYGQLDYSLRQDNRVVVMERVNARYIENLDEKVNLVTIDASFISLKLLLPVVKGWLQVPADVIPLIKPQFEAGKHDVGKGGVVKDPKIHIRVLEEILTFATHEGFSIKGLTLSPLKGPAGNIEFLAWLGWSDTQSPSPDLIPLIQSVMP
jgi:23S rRNA (cytidine1920-2'-O)/16S rRNA (cytidine1409-2'-O)-methyltransferase